jgi:hypothetical protein
MIKDFPERIGKGTRICVGDNGRRGGRGRSRERGEERKETV